MIKQTYDIFISVLQVSAYGGGGKLSNVRISTHLPRMTLGVLVNSKVTDVNKVVRQACILFPILDILVPAPVQRIWPTGAQYVCAPVEPRGHVGRDRRVTSKVELSPSPEQWPHHVSLKCAG